jgi:hypothetical protein
MLTWKLWRALNRPPLHLPLFRRAYARQFTPGKLRVISVPLMGCLRDLGLILLPVILILIGAPILVLIYYLALSIAPLLLPFANTLYGLAHTINASSGIAKEREQQTYDVLCTSPTGSLGMHWSYCTGWIHYHLMYRYCLLAMLSIGIVASIFGLSPQLVFGSAPSPLPIAVARAAALGALFVIDYAQTIVLSSLTTLIIPTYAENEGSARLWASSLFLLLQTGVYLPTLLFSTYALPGFFHLLRLEQTTADLLIPLLMLIFFAALRETLITGLWRAIKEQLSTNSVELDALTRLTV